MSYIYSDSDDCCSTASAELKLYQAFIFSVPIFFTFVLLFLFYLFYLRRRRVDWASLRMRNAFPNQHDFLTSQCEVGLKKEVREMLPVIIYKESYPVQDTQCSVCLGDYTAEDCLQQIPACGHTFHMDCIDHWFAKHTTCPLCRFSLDPSAKASDDQPDILAASTHETQVTGSGEETLQDHLHGCEDSGINRELAEPTNAEERSFHAIVIVSEPADARSRTDCESSVNNGATHC